MVEPPEVEPPLSEQSVPRVSLRNKLLVFAFALVALPGLGLGWLATRNASEALEQQVGRALAREARHTANQLSAAIRTERDALATFAQQDLMRDLRVGDVDKRVSIALAALRSRRAGAPQYLVVSEAGETIAASDPAAIGGTRAAAFAPALAESTTGVAGPLALPFLASPHLVIAAPVPDPDDASRRLGTLYGLYDWRDLSAVTEIVRQDLAAQRVATDVVVTEGGAVVGGEPAQLAGFARRGVRDAHTRPLAAPDWVAGKDAIVGRAALASGLPAFDVLVIQRREDVMAPVARLRSRMAVTLGVALAAALAAAAVAARRVVRPLTELAEALRQLAVRDGGAPLSVPVRSDDELGALAGAFNRMSADLERTQRELVEAEKFAFVGELAAGVAHEIRTSLGVLRSSAQLLDRSLPPDAGAEVHEIAQMVGDEVGRLGGVVDDLLTLKPDRTPALEPGALTPLLVRAAELAMHSARAKRIRILVAPAPEGEPLVAREPERIHQVAINLLVNAVQALGEGGTIEVSLLTGTPGFGGFEVRDDGPGIPAELRERVFQPFVTGRSGGVGLGLTFVKRVVHEHRGSIAIHSEPGLGTRVRVALPLAEVQG